MGARLISDSSREDTIGQKPWWGERGKMAERRKNPSKSHYLLSGARQHRDEIIKKPMARRLRGWKCTFSGQPGPIEPHLDMLTLGCADKHWQARDGRCMGDRKDKNIWNGWREGGRDGWWMSCANQMRVWRGVGKGGQISNKAWFNTDFFVSNSFYFYFFLCLSQDSATKLTFCETST